MEKSLFSKITKLAHKLTRAYKRKYTCHYLTQFGIFFKLLYSMYKRNTVIEKQTTVKQVSNGKVEKVTYYVKGKGLKLYYTTGIGDKINPNFKDIWTLAGKVTNLIPLLC